MLTHARHCRKTLLTGRAFFRYHRIGTGAVEIGCNILGFGVFKNAKKTHKAPDSRFISITLKTSKIQILDA